jgi:REP element-mobilizing transposase RayT
MSDPIGYLLTWTCYGTWLHGDPRGSVDDEHNVPGTPYVPDNPRRVARAQAQLCHAPTELDRISREIVADTINAHCRRRGWELHALNVRTNHVHLVVAAGDVPPEAVMTQLKAWTTRRLRAAGRFPPDQRVWTHHGSTRYLWKESSIAAAAAYVVDGQGADLT